MQYPRSLYTKDDQGKLIEPSEQTQTLWFWVERFQNEYARQNRSPQTIIEYGYDLASLLNFLAEKQISAYEQVTSNMLREYLDWLRLKDELSAVTINRRLSCIRSFFNFLREEKIIIIDPARDIKKAKQRKQAGHTYLISDEAKELLQSVDTEQNFGKRDLAMIVLMLFCGLRVSEVAALNISDIRFREKLLVVHGKGDKVRELPLDIFTLDTISAYLEVRPKPLLKPSPLHDADASPMDIARKQARNLSEEKDALFLSVKRSRITTRAIRMIVDKYVDKIDLENGKRISPHKLRHTFATLLYLNGADINVLRELLGHADLSTTQIYAAVDQERKKQAMAAHPLLQE